MLSPQPWRTGLDRHVVSRTSRESFPVADVAIVLESFAGRQDPASSSSDRTSGASQESWRDVRPFSIGLGGPTRIRTIFRSFVSLGAASVLLLTGLSLISGPSASAATTSNTPCNETVLVAPGSVVTTPSGALVVGAKAGSTKIAIDCNVASTATYALEASLLGGISSSTVTPTNEADTATLATFARSATDTGCPAATAGLCTTTTLVVPATFAGSDKNAVCPPTQTQINAGLFGCAVAIVNSALSPLPGGEFLITYAGQPLPGDPTISATPTAGAAGASITVADAKGATTHWWANAIQAVQAATLSTPVTSPPSSCTTGAGYGDVPTSLLAVKWFSSPTATPVAGDSAGVTISNDCYDGTTLHAPILGGSIPVPTGLISGTTYTVYLCELNATPYPSNDASAATHCGVAPAGATWVDASFPFTTSVGSLVQIAPTSGSVTVTGSTTFQAQLAVTGATGVVTYSSHGQGQKLNVSSLGLITTKGTLAAGTYTVTGTTSDTSGDVGVFSYSLSVGAIVQTVPLTGSVVATSSSSFTSQLAVSGSNGAVTYVKTGGSADLVISSSGVVRTTSSLAVGTYVVTGTTSDPNGDGGTFTFTLTVTPGVRVPVVLHAYRVVGHAVAGRTVTLYVDGTGFYGQPRITSHAGTVSRVAHDSGTVLTVYVSVRAGSRNGIFTFTIVLSNGKSCRVLYNQRV